jgi:hypothetical protein
VFDPSSTLKLPWNAMAAMTWVQLLKRVFNMDIEACGECGYPRGSGRVSFGQIAGIGPAGGVKGGGFPDRGGGILDWIVIPGRAAIQ